MSTASIPDMANEANPPRTRIRYLGRLLGDVIRAQEGDELFNKIEAVRSESVAAHRGAHAAPDEPTIATLSLKETVRLVQAFMLFSLLANLAEDRTPSTRSVSAPT